MNWIKHFFLAVGPPSADIFQTVPFNAKAKNQFNLNWIKDSQTEDMDKYGLS